VTEALGGAAPDAAVSTTALHWLSPDRLVAVYAHAARLLAPGGLLVTDNVLWGGDVVPGFVDPPAHDAASIAAIAAYNQQLTRDSRLQTTILPVGDGVALSYRGAAPPAA